MANIILITHWTGGDVFPFIKLGNEFIKQGHSVTICTHCYYEKNAKEKGLNFIPLDTPEFYEQMNQDLYKLADPIHNTQECIEFQLKYHGKERLIEEYNKILPLCNKADTIILARHRSSISGLLVAEKLKLPYASVVLAPNYFSHIDLHEKIFGQVLRVEINKAREILDLPPIESWKQWLYSPKHIWAIWPEWFASREEEWPEGVQTIGFLTENLDVEQEFSWEIEIVLNTREPVVLISGGSSPMVSPLFYQIAAEACELTGYRGILVTRYEELVPKELPRNILWVKQVKLASLMKRISLIIHHGGMGTLSESVDAGIPQIIMPHLTDGPDNASRLAKLGIAKAFPRGRWDAIHIAAAIDELLKEETKSRCYDYKEINKQVSKSELWNELIYQVTPYEGIVKQDLEQLDNDQIREHSLEGSKPSKEQLLKILKRKRLG